MTELTLEELKRAVDRLSIEDRLSLAEHVAQTLRPTRRPGFTLSAGEQRTPQDLYGIWRDHFPADVDLDAALHEIRHEWEKEWPEVFDP